MKAPDVLIVGAGIVGLASAYYLTRAGYSVTVIDKGHVANGASWGNAGLIVPCHSHPVPGPGVLWKGLKWMLSPDSPFYIKPRRDPQLARWLLHFARYCNVAHVERVTPLFRDIQRLSLELYATMIETEGINCSFERRGGLEVFLTEKAARSAAKTVAEAQHFGLDTTLLSRNELLEIEPALTPNVVAGIHYREDAHLEPGALVEGLAEVVKRRDGTIVTGDAVTGFETSNGRIQGVRTASETFSAGQVLLAAGAWSTKLAHSLDIPLLMEAAKGYSLTMARPAVCPRIPLHLAEATMAATPMGKHLRFAGTLELAPVGGEINQRRLEAVRQGGESYLRDNQPRQVSRVWAGMRPLAPDGLPYMGRPQGWENLVVATGHSTLGISMGASTGMLMSQILQRQTPELDLTPYAVDRFAGR